VSRRHEIELELRDAVEVGRVRGVEAHPVAARVGLERDAAFRVEASAGELALERVHTHRPQVDRPACSDGAVDREARGELRGALAGEVELERGRLAVRDRAVRLPARVLALALLVDDEALVGRVDLAPHALDAPRAGRQVLERKRPCSSARCVRG
jgi:hypothetical protein